MNNKTPEDILVEKGYDDVIVFRNPDYDEAIIGVDTTGRVIYDFDLMVGHLMTHDNMDEMEAIEFIDYNIIGFSPPAGVDGPIVMYKLLG